jgi:glutamate synthase (NADPH/NADH) small chain
LSFIRAYKSQPPGTVEVGRRVVVVGAGNTAVDAATAAVRLGAERVVMMYRRGRDEMPAYDFEYELAKQDGVRFEWWTAPLEIRGRNGAVEGMRCARLQAGAPGSDGRSVPVAIPGSDFVLETDMVIPAIGQTKRQDWLSKIPGLELDHGRVVVDETTGMTSVPGIFSGGDCANGGMEVVNAVAEGQRAARGMHAFWKSTAARPQD